MRAIGSSGWNWHERRQYYIGIDIDSLATHAGKTALTEEELGEVRARLESVDFVEVRRSSSGTGYHAYIWFDEEDRPEVNSRDDISAVGQAVLELISRTGFDVRDRVDCVASNIWFRRGDNPDNAYELVHPAGRRLKAGELPPGWREQKRHFANSGVRRQLSKPAVFPTLTPCHTHIIEEMTKDLPYTVIYSTEFGCYHTHTCLFAELFTKHEFDGFFETESEGTDPGAPNCYAWPIGDAGFLIKRFGENTKEADSWLTSKEGRDYAKFNVPLTIEEALRPCGAMTIEQGWQVSCEKLVNMFRYIGNPTKVPDFMQPRKAEISYKRGRYFIKVPHRDEDTDAFGWTVTGSRPPRWETSVESTKFISDEDVSRGLLDFIRPLSTQEESNIWMLKDEEHGWKRIDANQVGTILVAHGIEKPGALIGVLREKFTLELVNEPFQAEYLPGRRWNRNTARIKYQKADVDGETPTFDAVFGHIGESLDAAVASDPWCQDNNIDSGKLFLDLWQALTIRNPFQSLPYLFLFSSQNTTGKSAFGWTFEALITPGVKEITNESFRDKFTSELEDCIVARLEEFDLSDKRGQAYAALKSFMSNRKVNIRRMRTDTYQIRNCLHFIHTSNFLRYCPIDEFDERIIMLHIDPLSHKIGDLELQRRLDEEAPCRLRYLMGLTIPPADGRFHLPVLTTDLKQDAVAEIIHNEPSAGERMFRDFLKDRCVFDANARVTRPYFYEEYVEYHSESVRDLEEDKRTRPVAAARVLKLMRDNGHKVEANDNKMEYEGNSPSHVGQRRRYFQGVRVKKTQRKSEPEQGKPIAPFQCDYVPEVNQSV